MPGSTLYRGEKVFDESNYRELLAHHQEQLADGTIVGVHVTEGGEKRYLAAMPPSLNQNLRSFCESFGASGLKLIDKSDLDAAIDDQIARKARVSDHVDFQQFSQNGLPTCWAICTAQCYSIKRRINGLPHRVMSGCSLAVPISGGHRGGWEGDSLEYAVKHGIASTDTWPENNTSRSYIDSQAVAVDREMHKVLKWVDLESDQQWWSALLQTLPGVFAYGWMSHCMTMCDFVRIEAGSYGYRPRNTWYPWGSKNDKGFDGFNVYRMGKGTPDSGAVLLEIMPSEK